MDDGEAARAFEDMEYIIFKKSHVLVKGVSYLSEAVHVCAHFAQDLSSSFGVNKSVMKWKSIFRISKPQFLLKTEPHGLADKVGIKMNIHLMEFLGLS